MQIIAVAANDLTNPVEVNAWFVNNPTIALHSIVIEGSWFYIVYQ